MSKQTCKTCGKSCEGDFCFVHKKRKPLNVKSIAIKSTYIVHKLIMEEKPSMREFFVNIWKNRTHRSEVSNENLGREPLSIFFHHILAKEKYKQAEFDEENIILLTLDEHTNVENDMYRYDEINDRRESLKIKYNIA